MSYAQHRSSDLNRRSILSLNISPSSGRALLRWERGISQMSSRSAGFARLTNALSARKVYHSLEEIQKIKAATLQLYPAAVGLPYSLDRTGWSVGAHGSVLLANPICPVKRRKTYDPRQKRPKISAARAASSSA